MCLSPVHSSGTCTTYGDLLHFPHLGPEHIFSGSIGHPCGSTGADRWFVPDWMIDGSRPRLFYPVKSIGREQKQSAYTLLKLGLDKKMIISSPPPSTILDVRIVLWAPEKRTNVRDRRCFGTAYIIPFYTCDCHAPIL